MNPNWSEICNIKDGALSIALSVVDTDTVAGQSLLAEYPQCFHPHNGVERPITLQTIKGHMCTNTFGIDMLVERSLEALKIPYICWAVDDAAYRTYADSVVGILPKALSLDTLTSGQTVTFRFMLPIRGEHIEIVATLVVISIDEEEVIMAPIERVQPTTSL